jgi:hypothetical protein
MTDPLLWPEPPRLDRHDTYIGMQLYVWLASIGIFLLPIGTGTIGTMDPQQQKLLAVAMFIGSTLCLAGAAMGEPFQLRLAEPVRWFLRRKWLEKIRRHVYTPLPVRHCYRLGVAGLVATVTALAFFSAQLLTTGSIIGSMTGLLPPILAIVWTRKARKFWRRATAMDREFEALKQELKEEH